MTQAELDQAVATATGEPLSEIQRLGFDIAPGLPASFAPEALEPTDELDRYIDWDEADAHRNVALFDRPNSIAAGLAR